MCQCSTYALPCMHRRRGVRRAVNLRVRPKWARDAPSEVTKTVCPTLKATPHAHRWAGLIGSRRKAESISALKRPGIEPTQNTNCLARVQGRRHERTQTERGACLSTANKVSTVSCRIFSVATVWPLILFALPLPPALLTKKGARKWQAQSTRQRTRRSRLQGGSSQFRRVLTVQRRSVAEAAPLLC